MDKPIYAREHDLLKLCDEFRNNSDEDGKIIRIHYCPEELARIDERLYEQLKKSPLWPSLRHHCNLGFDQSHKAHGCTDYKNRTRCFASFANAPKPSNHSANFSMTKPWWLSICAKGVLKYGHWTHAH